MLGAIAGDIIGSVYEARPIKTKDFPLFDRECCFTDDSVLTIAVADAILSDYPYKERLLAFGRQYPQAGYGGSFIRWLQSAHPRPYNSFGNGAAMRVSPVGFAFPSEQEVLQQAKMTATVSHNHPEGIKGAQATALTVFLARFGRDKSEIKKRIAKDFDYDLDRTIDAIRPRYAFDATCQGTIPEAIISFLQSHCYEDAIRNAVSLGGDSDTLACITGGMAEAFYGGVPQNIYQQVSEYLTPDLSKTVNKFYTAYM